MNKTLLLGPEAIRGSIVRLAKARLPPTGCFEGPVMPISPRSRAVAGVLAYPDVASLPIEPDLAIIRCPPGRRVVRAINDPDNTVAECSVVVRSDLKRKGLGCKLMGKIIEYCRNRGTRMILGQVMRENRAPLALADSIGFQRNEVAGEPEICEVWLDLQEPQREQALPLASPGPALSSGGR